MGAKVGFSLALIVTALLLRRPLAILVVGVVALVALLIFARIRPTLVAGAMAAPLIFLVIGAITVAISVGPPSVNEPDGWRWGWFLITKGGLYKGWVLLCHGISGTLSIFVLAMTTPMVDLLTWLRRLRVPDALLDIASLMYRLLFGLLASVFSIREAQAARLGGAKFSLGESNRWERFVGQWRAVAGLMGSILLRSWAHADRLQQGLAGRGYEVALTTLPPKQAPSTRFMISAGLTLALIWIFACLIR